jgi:hypothetical protein
VKISGKIGKHFGLYMKYSWQAHVLNAWSPAGGAVLEALETLGSRA